MDHQPAKCKILAESLMLDFGLLVETNMSLFTLPNGMIHGNPAEAHHKLNLLAGRWLTPEPDQAQTGIYTKELGKKAEQMRMALDYMGMGTILFKEETRRIPESGIPAKEYPQLAKIASDISQLRSDFLDEAIYLICGCESGNIPLDDKGQRARQSQLIKQEAEAIEQSVEKLIPKLIEGKKEE